MTLPSPSARPLALLWLRRDLRITDNPALFHAVASKLPVVPVFIWAPEEEKPWNPGAASRVWLHHSLLALQKSYTALGSSLVLRKGPSLAALRQLAQETGATHLFANALPEPHLQKRDATLLRTLQKEGLQVEVFSEATYLHHPDRSLNSQGKPYQVFTPFYRAQISGIEPDSPYPKPAKMVGTWEQIASLPLADFQLLPRIPWDQSLLPHLEPGETAAWNHWQRFQARALAHYAEDRDYPGREGISGLSPYLHFGEISVRSLWWSGRQSKGPSEPWLRQLAWREFAYHLLHHFPHTTQEPLRSPFKNFPWIKSKVALRAWQKGLTGYPLVDAGMRELWQTGRMHNRVRMVAASFLVKHLLQPWQAGAEWFWDTLVDADLANNAMGWQWVAGSGADAAPYFRIFNPVTQSERFDPQGQYLRRWLPELAKLPDALLHQPWKATPLELALAKVQLGQDYPQPIIEHDFARERALGAYRQIKDQGQRS
jgi:deoxyribodipyrimidine photo-lyase